MKYVIVLFLIFSNQSMQAEDNDWDTKRSNYAIDWKYHAGQFLIYDCDRKHYACVDSDGFDKCTTARNKSKAEKAKKYSCAPISKYENKEACVLANYKVLESLALKRFCYP